MRIVTDRMMHRATLTAFLHPLNRTSRIRILEAIQRTQNIANIGLKRIIVAIFLL